MKSLMVFILFFYFFILDHFDLSIRRTVSHFYFIYLLFLLFIFFLCLDQFAFRNKFDRKGEMAKTDGLYSSFSNTLVSEGKRPIYDQLKYATSR
jgi:cbb3-type cytochrome oxidase subunit 3